MHAVDWQSAEVSDEHLYDVIIVGAGPGGSSLAARLASAGIDVLVLEKSRFPRYKTCGGGVTKRALAKMPTDITSVIRNSITTFELIYDGGAAKEFHSKTPCMFTVMRDELDALLARHAVSCGAHLVTGAYVNGIVEQADRVTVLTRQRKFAGRYVVGADGVNSLVAKQAGLMKNRRKALALEYEIACSPSVQARLSERIVVDYGSVPFGYAWIFPKHDHLSVGVGSYTIGGSEMAGLLEKFIQIHQLDGEGLSAKGFFLSVGGEQQSIMTKRIALIGDAAGLVEACAGEGIYYALWSAELIAARLQEALSGEDNAFANYQSDIDHVILPELRTLERMGTFLYNNAGFAQQMITRFPWLMRLLFDALEGKRSYNGLFTTFAKFTDLSRSGQGAFGAK